MTRKQNDYWKDRFKTIEAASNAYGQDVYRQIEPAFNQAQREVQAAIDTWYTRVAKNNQVSISEARKLLSAKELAEFKWDVKEFIKYGEENALDPIWMKQLENASAKYHISRLEALKIQTQQSMEKAFGNELDDIDIMARKLYTDDYYHSAYEIQRGLNVGWDVSKVDVRRLEKLISKPWATDGKNFSDRIWQSKTSMVNELHNELVRICILGKSPDEAIRHMTKFVDKRFSNAKMQAGRLVMTEQAFFASAAQKDCFNELDVEEFEVVATLDSLTSVICQEMDGKHFPMQDYVPGVTAPPFHVWCRSTTVPFFDDEWSTGERAARGEDGKTYFVPESMKYDDWKKSFVDGGTKDGLKPISESDIIESKVTIQELSKLKNSGMTENDYGEYLNIINSHSNTNVRQLYLQHADKIKSVKYSPTGGQYSQSLNTLDFSYPKYDDMNKYGTLAHEYGHFFDSISFENVHFKEIDTVRNATGLDILFKNDVSSSDEFLAAIRKDKVHIKSIFTPDIKADLMAHNASSGVQDAIDGLFPKSRIRWGHGERYYNRKYADIEFMDKMAGTSRKKELQQVYKDLGFDASNQAKVKTICRQYEAASEAWANVMSAEINGGEALKYVKEYLPNSYQAMIEILKGVK